MGPVATYRLAAVAANAFGEYGVLELYRRRLGVGSRVATHDFRAVSYTHLDVYKRQDLSSQLSFQLEQRPLASG